MYSRHTKRTCLRTLLPVIVIILVGISQLISGISLSFASPASQERNIDTSPIPSLASACPSSIYFGETIECSITIEEEIDSYTFAANAGDKVLVRMSRASGTLTLHVRVKAPDGTDLCEAYNSLPAEIESCTLPSTGIYTILAGNLVGGNTGDYYLYLQRLNDPGGAVPIAFGQTHSGSIMPGEIDTYTFSAVAGDKVLVRMSRASGLMTLEVRVFGPTGALQCERYNSLPAEIESCTLPSTGTYTILADDMQGINTGDYLLFLQRLNAPLTPYSVFLPSVRK